jgi:probable HAF family extracellular repeat protein
MTTKQIGQIVPSQLAGARYAVTFLGANMQPRDINNLGTVIGNVAAPTGDLAFVMLNGVLTYVPTLGGTFTVLNAINELGQITGWSALPEQAAQHAILFQEGLLRDLGTLGGKISAGNSLNNAGQVVGFSETASGEFHAFLYFHGRMFDLGALPKGNYSIAYDVNNRGQVVGESAVGTGPASASHPFLWDKGVMIDLGSFGGTFAAATAVNDRGQVTGYASLPDETFHLFVYEKGVLRDLGSFGGYYIAPTDINNQGQIVGVADNGVTSFAFLYSGGALVTLDSLVDPALGWDIYSARSINDQGQILAVGCRGDQCGALRLDPVIID